MWQLPTLRAVSLFGARIRASDISVLVRNKGAQGFGPGGFLIISFLSFEAPFSARLCIESFVTALEVLRFVEDTAFEVVAQFGCSE